MIGSRMAIARRHLRIALSNPGAPVPDGDGGYTQTTVPLDPPSLFGYVRPVSSRDLERITASTVISQASHMVSLPYHPGVDTTTELRVERPAGGDRRFAVVAVLNPDERDADLLLVCAEVVE